MEKKNVALMSIENEVKQNHDKITVSDAIVFSTLLFKREKGPQEEK